METDLFLSKRKYKDDGLKKFIDSILLCLLCLGFCFLPPLPVQAEEEPVIVVIDPGHGGENLGGEYEDYTEKDMTLIVANAMKEELEQYEGITVYLTRTDDTELSLEERAEFAKSVNADFLYCLHFNLSEHHTLFGAECWVSAFGENYSKGYSFASIEMDMLTETGLYSRGIKTRLNSSGIDYYGIIRASTERDIPCVLIEHCHLDEENDKPFYDHDEKLKEFGRLDATAVAKYFRLKSDSLSKDYTGYKNLSVAVPANVVKPDSTPPDVCMIELVDQKPDTGEVTLRVTATDYDSGMLYYAYSYDGGTTYTNLQKWPERGKDIFEFTMQVPSETTPQILVNAYNGYDLYTTSNQLDLPTMHYGQEETEEAENPDSAAQNTVPSSSAHVISKEDYQEITYDTTDQETEPETVKSFGYFLQVTFICILLLLGMVFSMVLILRGRRKRKRKPRR